MASERGKSNQGDNIAVHVGNRGSRRRLDYSGRLLDRSELEPRLDSEGARFTGDQDVDLIDFPGRNAASVIDALEGILQVCGKRPSGIAVLDTQTEIGKGVNGDGRRTS